ncbi:hypothetical protein KBC86_00325, partial [Candidatus Gracilibacteria bacterium]|nr:hypothetical protein [Candidatus Gracilibacteria bacterium]
MNISQKLILLSGIIFGGILLTCGGNIIVAPGFGLNPDSPGVLESWFSIWKIEIMIVSLLAFLYVFYFYERMTEQQKNLLKKLWKFSF